MNDQELIERAKKIMGIDLPVNENPKPKVSLIAKQSKKDDAVVPDHLQKHFEGKDKPEGQPF